ncbi:MAG TPA: Xaa-Pro peptidase family protein [Puia sp.]|nr:Xaa-Pro peptidase family protein [Puia sp.]
MSIKRRDFIKFSAGSAAAGTAMVSGITSFASVSKNGNNIFDKIKSITNDVVPISVEERRSRIEKAQKLMAGNNIHALLLDSGTSLVYFTGIQWWPSERTMVAIIPAKGEVKYVSPAFEADRLRELIKIGNEVRIWEEDESPYKVIANTLRDYGIAGGNIGIEERLRFFIYDGVRKEAPALNFVSGDPVTVPCRMIKSPAEIALLQKANDITIAAIKIVADELKEGMSNGEVSGLIDQAQRKLGGSSDGALVNIGISSALPHGSIKAQHIQKGDIVLIDCGCRVEGYCSDITRTFVFGEPTKRQREIWELEKKAQAAAFAAAKLGQPCENVDMAARKVLTDAGFGPDYKLPGCPHRTGHGIGMDGHEWGNMVRGNKQPLQTGMCFSVEPTIVIPGEFGIRLEDCAYMTEDGPQWFTSTKTSGSIDHPFA